MSTELDKRRAKALGTVVGCTRHTLRKLKEQRARLIQQHAVAQSAPDSDQGQQYITLLADSIQRIDQTVSEIEPDYEIAFEMARVATIKAEGIATPVQPLGPRAINLDDEPEALQRVAEFLVEGIDGGHD